MIPVAIVTSEKRNDYLKQTLEGLWASNIPAALPVSLFIDASPDHTPSQIEGLLPRHCMIMKLTREGLCEGEIVARTGASLAIVRGCMNTPLFPSLLTHKGLRVHRSDGPIGSWTNHARAFTFQMMEWKNAPACIVVQDDVLFKPDWYERLTEAFYETVKVKPTLAILTGYKGETQGKYPSREGVFPKMPGRTIGAVCWLMTRFLFENSRKFFTKGMSVFKTNVYDTRVETFLELRNMDYRVLRPGVVQHVGQRSLSHPHASGKRSRRDDSVTPPFAGGFSEPLYPERIEG